MVKLVSLVNFRINTYSCDICIFPLGKHSNLLRLKSLEMKREDISYKPCFKF